MASLNYIYRRISELIEREDISHETPEEMMVELLQTRDQINELQIIGEEDLYEVQEDMELGRKQGCEFAQLATMARMGSKTEVLMRGAFPKYSYRPLDVTAERWVPDHLFGEGSNEDLKSLMEVTNELIMKNLGFPFLTLEQYKSHIDSPEMLRALHEFMEAAASPRPSGSPYFVCPSKNAVVVERFGLEMVWMLYGAAHWKAWSTNIEVILTLEPDRVRAILRKDFNMHFLKFIEQSSTLRNHPNIDHCHRQWKRARWIHAVTKLEDRDLEELDKNCGYQKVNDAVVSLQTCRSNGQPNQLLVPYLAGDTDEFLRKNHFWSGSYPYALFVLKVKNLCDQASFPVSHFERALRYLAFVQENERGGYMRLFQYFLQYYYDFRRLGRTREEFEKHFQFDASYGYSLDELEMKLPAIQREIALLSPRNNSFSI